MAMNVYLKAPKELRSQVEMNLSHREQPPLLKTHLSVLDGTLHEVRAGISVHKGACMRGGMRSRNVVWVNRRAKISLFCF